MKRILKIFLMYATTFDWGTASTKTLSAAQEWEALVKDQDLFRQKLLSVRLDFYHKYGSLLVFVKKSEELQKMRQLELKKRISKIPEKNFTKDLNLLNQLLLMIQNPGFETVSLEKSEITKLLSFIAFCRPSPICDRLQKILEDYIQKKSLQMPILIVEQLLSRQGKFIQNFCDFLKIPFRAIYEDWSFLSQMPLVRKQLLKEAWKENINIQDISWIEELKESLKFIILSQVKYRPLRRRKLVKVLEDAFPKDSTNDLNEMKEFRDDLLMTLQNGRTSRPFFSCAPESAKCSPAFLAHKKVPSSYQSDYATLQRRSLMPQYEQFNRPFFYSFIPSGKAFIRRNVSFQNPDIVQTKTGLGLYQKLCILFSLMICDAQAREGFIGIIAPKAIQDLPFAKPLPLQPVKRFQGTEIEGQGPVVKAVQGLNKQVKDFYVPQLFASASSSFKDVLSGTSDRALT